MEQTTYQLTKDRLVQELNAVRKDTAQLEDEISIKKLSYLIAKYTNYNGKIIFDKTSPDGTFRKNLDSSKIRNLGWKPKINFKIGLKKVIYNRSY